MIYGVIEGEVQNPQQNQTIHFHLALSNVQIFSKYLKISENLAYYD